MLSLRNLQILVIRYTAPWGSRLFALLMQCDQHQSKVKAEVILGETFVAPSPATCVPARTSEWHSYPFRDVFRPERPLQEEVKVVAQGHVIVREDYRVWQHSFEEKWWQRFIESPQPGQRKGTSV